jgi:hypothetical protein
MIHTAKFFLLLSKKDVDFITKKYNERITLIGDIVDINFKGIKTSIIKKMNKWILFVTIDCIELLGKADILEEDFNDLNNKMNDYLFGIFNNRERELILLRLDYRLDVVIKKVEQRELLLYLYVKKTTEKYMHKKKYSEFDTSVYFNTNSKQCFCYDKDFQRTVNNQEIMEYEKDVIRYEVRLQNKHLNYNKRTHGIDKNIKNYFKEDLWRKYMEKDLGNILYKGDYYKIYMADKIILNSNLIKESEKKFIREFLCDVSLKNINGVKEMIDSHGKLKYTKYKFNKAIKVLGLLGINPLLIPKNLKIDSHIENPFKL